MNRRVRHGAAVILSLLLSLTVPATGEVSPEPSGTSAVFETRESLGDAAVAVHVEAPHGVFCFFHVSLAGTFPSNGVVDRLYHAEWTDGRTDWVHGTFSQSVYGHLEGVVDTRSTMNNFWHAELKFIASVHPGVTVTVTGPQLAPWPGSIEDGPEESVRVEVECDGHASFSLSGSREVVLLSTANAPNGAGAGLFTYGEGVLMARTGGDFSAPEVKLRAGTDGLNFGSLMLGRPEGIAPQPWILESGEKKTIMADGGPGESEMVLNRVGDRNGFWALLAGWWPVDDLDEVTELPNL